jgi:hypothetical protein
MDRHRAVLVGAAAFAAMISILSLETRPIALREVVAAAGSLAGLMILPWALVVAWAAGKGLKSLEGRAGVVAAVLTFAGLVALIHGIDGPGSLLDVPALVAVFGWPVMMILEEPFRDWMPVAFRDALWALGAGASPVVWCAILVWCAKRSAFVRQRMLGLA